MFGKVKIDAADRLFSEYIRKRDKVCVRCKRSAGLTCSHYWGRKNENTRYDLENADALCISCHLAWEHEKGFTIGTLLVGGQSIPVELPKPYTQWKLKQLGQARYDALKLRAHTYKKKDRKFELIRIKQMMKNENQKAS